jgi:hypothetical protein
MTPGFISRHALSVLTGLRCIAGTVIVLRHHLFPIRVTMPLGLFRLAARADI